MDHTLTGSQWAYQEREAELEDQAIRMKDRPHFRLPAVVRNGGFHPLPMPDLTPEQARAHAWRLYGCLIDLHNVLAERGLVTDCIVSHVWGSVRRAVRDASKYTPTAGDNPADGSGALAGEGEIHRSAGEPKPATTPGE